MADGREKQTAFYRYKAIHCCLHSTTCIIHYIFIQYSRACRSLFSTLISLSRVALWVISLLFGLLALVLRGAIARSPRLVAIRIAAPLSSLASLGSEAVARLFLEVVAVQIAVLASDPLVSVAIVWSGSMVLIILRVPVRGPFGVTSRRVGLM